MPDRNNPYSLTVDDLKKLGNFQKKPGRSNAQMSSTPMTKDAAARIQSNTDKNPTRPNDGFKERAQSAAARNENASNGEQSSGQAGQGETQSGNGKSGNEGGK
ncbi:MAG: hypothetical protein Q9182_005063 [Xanthomendoza sp. 2 TL-2023]